MSGFWVPTKSGKKGPFSEDQICDLVDAGKLPLEFKVEDADGNKIVVEDIYYEDDVEEAAPIPEDDFDDNYDDFDSADDFDDAEFDAGVDDEADSFENDEFDEEEFDNPEPPAAPPRRAAPRRAAPVRGSAPAPRSGAPRRAPARGASRATAPRKGSKRELAGVGGSATERAHPGSFKRKKSPLPMIIILVLLVGGVGVATWVMRPEAIFGLPYLGSWSVDFDATFDAMMEKEKVEDPAQEAAMREFVKAFVGSMRLKIADGSYHYSLGEHDAPAIKYSIKKLSDRQYRMVPADDTVEAVEFWCNGWTLILEEKGQRVHFTRA